MVFQPRTLKITFSAPSLHKCIIDHLMSRMVLAFLGLLFKVKVFKLGTDVGLNILINKNSGFVINTKNMGDFSFSK